MLAGSHATQTSNKTDVPFAYSSARVRMLKQRMLSRADVERLLTAPSVQAGMRVLADTEYASAIAAVGRSDDYELVLSAELQRVYDLVTSFAPQQELLKMWAARLAFLGLKMLLKAGLQKQDYPTSFCRRGCLWSAADCDRRLNWCWKRGGFPRRHDGNAGT